MGRDDTEAAVLPLIDGISAANKRLREEHERLLQQAARLLLRIEELPTGAVELGRLGLRYRREDEERNSAR